MQRNEALFGALIRLADYHLSLGHRLSEWCGHAPMLEEDLALPNIGLDLIGQSRPLYTYAGEVEGKGRGEDDFAYRRLERDYRNLLLVERPNVDFGHTMLRQLYYSAFMEPFWREAQSSTDETIAGIAAKAVKEVAYHVRHSGEWVIRLGDGTEESARRMADAVEALAPYLDEMFAEDEAMDAAADYGLIPAPKSLRAEWDARIDAIFAEAQLERTQSVAISGGRQGRHGEQMGFLLADLQYVQRTFPGLTW